jgi:phosphoribosylformylglycinamidine cyclo-ligase
MSEGLTYRASGVDIAAADDFVRRVKGLAARTHGDRVVPATAAFAGLIRAPVAGMTSPLLAACCDGVGTKVLVARDAGRFLGLGQDLVAMNVNDLLPVGAAPLFFLDYIAAGRLDPDALTEVVEGIAGACEEVGCVLLGGETAEMPDVYDGGDFDLAGFAVGLVDEARVPRGTARAGDVVLGLPSSGVHANGLSLARRAIFDRAGLDVASTPPELGGRTVGEALLVPTRLYVRQVLALLDGLPASERGGPALGASAHVTGGGLDGRARAMLPAGLAVRFDRGAWPSPAIFDLIRRCGEISDEEMGRTFNLGLGYLVVLAPDVAATVLAGGGEWLRVGEVVHG